MELVQINRDLAEVVAAVRRSLVRIDAGQRAGGAGHWSGRATGAPRPGRGSGTIWHPDGLIVTNAHVVTDRAPTVVLPDGRGLPARVVAYDRELDLAVLVVRAHDLPAIALGESTRLRPGELVLAMGHPWGVAGAVTVGTVIGVGVDSGLGQPLEGGEWRGRRAETREWLTASLRVRPGHSGGPLVDVNGRLVGINTIMAGPGVGVAVPVHVVKRFLRQKLAVPAAAP